MKNSSFKIACQVIHDVLAIRKYELDSIVAFSNSFMKVIKDYYYQSQLV